MPLIIAAGIGAAGSIGGSAIASHGVSKATQANQEGVTKGIDAVTRANAQARLDLQQANQRAQSLYDPYVQFGRQSLASLAQRYGQPSPPQANASGQSLASLGQRSGQPSAPQANAWGSGLVVLKAPNGETKSFDANDPAIPTLIQRGAVRASLAAFGQSAYSSFGKPNQQSR